ncbi:MAG TPA: enoyl-CoA hydratase-related protein [Anaeromyxobacter sp.]
MAYENLLFEVDDGIAVLTFNRPKVLNALNAATIAELGEAVAQVEGDRAIRGLVLTGAGEKAFVAGADIPAMSQMTALEARRFAETAHAILARMEALPIVTVAAVNGFALGGGCEVAMACDLVYAGEKAKFGQPEVNLGIIPGFGGTQRLTRRVGPSRALELVLSGDVIDAQKAKEIGLALEVLPAADLLAFAKGQARKVAGKGPLAVAVAKRLVREGADADLRTANELERQAFAGIFATDDAREGMKAFAEKRPAVFKGS